jgi:hypothetical protein
MRDRHKQRRKSAPGGVATSVLQQLRSGVGGSPRETSQMRALHFDAGTIDQSLGTPGILQATECQAVSAHEPERPHFAPLGWIACRCQILSAAQLKVSGIALLGCDDFTIGRSSGVSCKSQYGEFPQRGKLGNEHSAGIPRRATCVSHP